MAAIVRGAVANTNFILSTHLGVFEVTTVAKKKHKHTSAWCSAFRKTLIRVASQVLGKKPLMSVWGNWACPACTFSNLSQHLQCSLCRHHKPFSAFSSVSQSDVKSSSSSSSSSCSSSSAQSALQYLAASEDEGGWLFKSRNEDIDSFLKVNELWARHLQRRSWLSVPNEAEPRDGGVNITFTEHKYGVYAQYKRMVRERASNKQCVRQWEKNAVKDAILDVARGLGETSGKWLVMPRDQSYHEDEHKHKKRCQNTWDVLARATCKGELGDSIKISATLDEEEGEVTRVICVYVSFNNMNRVRDVLRKLLVLAKEHDFGEYVQKGYKPDVFTHLGIYGTSKKEHRFKTVTVYQEMFLEVKEDVGV
jgi:hypothetical protein